MLGASTQLCLAICRSSSHMFQWVPRPSPACPTTTLAPESISGCWSLAQSGTPQTHSTPMSRDATAMSSPDHSPHSGSNAHQWELQPSWVILLASCPSPLSVTDLAYAGGFPCLVWLYSHLDLCHWMLKPAWLCPPPVPTLTCECCSLALHSLSSSLSFIQVGRHDCLGCHAHIPSCLLHMPVC